MNSKQDMKPIIPRTLDESGRSFFGLQDDVLVVGAGIWLLLMGFFDMPFWGLLTGVVVAYIYSRIRSKTFVRWIMRMWHWYLPCEISLIRGGVPSHMRRLYLRKRIKNDKS